jgi:hypothetical protein
MENYMQIYKRSVVIFVLATLLAFTSCDNDGVSEGGGDVDVIFQSATQIGGVSGAQDSSGITLSFDVAPVTLTADNITVTGAAKGALSGSGKTRTLSISNITVADRATISVAITSPSGYSITGSPQTAAVYGLLAIGMDCLGGKIACKFQSGDPGYVAGKTHGLIAAAADQDDGTGIIWALVGQNGTGST